MSEKEREYYEEIIKTLREIQEDVKSMLNKESE